MMFGSSLRSSMQRQRVIVTMTNDQGIDGILWAADKTGYKLVASGDRRVELITLDGERQPMDGQAFVPAERVAFVQVVGGG